MGKAPQENAEQAFQLGVNCKRRKSRICSHKVLPRPLLNFRRPGGVNPIRERRHWVELWENMRMDCAGGMLISPRKLENVLKKLKNGKGSPDQITADVLKALPPACLEKLARSLSLMCWDMNFPENWLCSLTVMAPKVVGATCLTKFRPTAGLCAMRKVLGYVWLKSLPPLKYESVQTAFVPKTHADAGSYCKQNAPHRRPRAWVSKKFGVWRTARDLGFAVLGWYSRQVLDDGRHFDLIDVSKFGVDVFCIEVLKKTTIAHTRNNRRTNTKKKKKKYMSI